MTHWYQLQDNHLILHLKIQPNARTTTFMEILNSHRKIAIKAPPHEGEANAELIRFIAKTFKVPQKEVHIIRGTTSRMKTIKLPRTVQGERFVLAENSPTAQSPS